jgi:hypothetical protein
MSQLLRIPDIPQRLVEILVESGAVPSQTDLLAAVEAGVPGLEMWPRTCKALGVPTRLTSYVEAIWCNTTLPVRPVPGNPLLTSSIAYSLLPWQVDKETPKDAYAIILSAFYCNRQCRDDTYEFTQAQRRLQGGHLQDLSKWLQPEEYILLLQLMLKEDWPQGFLFRSFLANPCSFGSKALTSKLLDLLEANQAHITYTSVCALLRSQPLSASELLSALERFAHHQVLVQVLSFHPAASSLTSAELLEALQQACSTGNTQYLCRLCQLPSVRALSAEELLPILAAAAATANEYIVFSMFQLPAAKQITPDLPRPQGF